MQAGKLDRRGTLQRNTPVPDGFGQPVASWADVATMWCQFVPLDTREVYEEGQERVAWADAKFVLRWRSDVTPTAKDRFVCMGRTYDVLGVTQTPRLQTVELHCKARADAA